MVISLDLSGRRPHLAEAEYSGGAVKVVRFCSPELPEGCVRNGIVADEEAFVSAISASMKQSGFKSRKFCVTVGSGVIATKVMAVPAVREGQLRSVIKGEIEQLGTGADQRSRPSESIFDYTVLGADPGNPEMLRVMAVMLPAAVAESWLSIIQKLGKKPETLDCWSNSALKAISLEPELAQCPAGLVVSLDADAVNLLLFEKGEYGFYRNMPVSAGGSAVQSEFILSTFENTAAPSEEDNVYAAAYDGISKLLQFQSIRSRQNPVSRIALCGALSGNEALVSRISEAFGIPAAPIEGLHSLTCPGGMPVNEYLCAVGAAIRR